MKFCLLVVLAFAYEGSFGENNIGGDDQQISAEQALYNFLESAYPPGPSCKDLAKRAREAKTKYIQSCQLAIQEKKDQDARVGAAELAALKARSSDAGSVTQDAAASMRAGTVSYYSASKAIDLCENAVIEFNVTMKMTSIDIKIKEVSPTDTKQIQECTTALKQVEAFTDEIKVAHEINFSALREARNESSKVFNESVVTRKTASGAATP